MQTLVFCKVYPKKWFPTNYPPSQNFPKRKDLLSFQAFFYPFTHIVIWTLHTHKNIYNLIVCTSLNCTYLPCSSLPCLPSFSSLTRSIQSTMDCIIFFKCLMISVSHKRAIPCLICLFLCWQWAAWLECFRLTNVSQKTSWYMLPWAPPVVHQ